MKTKLLRRLRREGRCQINIYSVRLGISILRWAYEHLNDGKYGHAIRCLSEAGALIAAEIDRINNLKRE